MYRGKNHQFFSPAPFIIGQSQQVGIQNPVTPPLAEILKHLKKFRRLKAVDDGEGIIGTDYHKRRLHHAFHLKIFSAGYHEPEGLPDPVIRDQRLILVAFLLLGPVEIGFHVLQAVDGLKIPLLSEILSVEEAFVYRGNFSHAKLRQAIQASVDLAI